MTIAQTQTEETRRPSMTHFTSQCACQNRANSDRSEEVSGSTDCATSAGFIACVPQVSLRPCPDPYRLAAHSIENRDGAPPGAQQEPQWPSARDRNAIRRRRRISREL